MSRIPTGARTWLLFALCLAVAFAGMGWISLTTWRLDRAQTAAARQETVGENTRLALWRMDSEVLPLLMQENARPYYQYSAEYHRNAELRRLRSVQANTDESFPPPPDRWEAWSPLMGSPLATQPGPYIKLYFQVDPAGAWRSPQVPPPSPASPPASAEQTACSGNLSALRQALVPADLLRRLSAPPQTAFTPSNPLASDDRGLFPVSPAQPPGGLGKGATAGAAEQVMKSSNEYQMREAALNRAAQLPNQTSWPLNSPQQSQQAFNQATPPAPPVGRPVATPPAVNTAPTTPAAPAIPAAPAPTPALAHIYSQDRWFQSPADAPGPSVGSMQPVWADGRLILARRVDAAGCTFLQGAWIDWPALQAELLGQVRDLLPHARLEPILGAADAPAASLAPSDGEHRLALLPVQLIPGAVPFDPPPGLTPVERTLLVAWIAITLAALAVAALLFGVLRLSERRAAFVSAVTHELRTPLTTFQMYTEMLEGGMVPDETRRAAYISTLRAEAKRLGHLVDNVLAYAQLERAPVDRVGGAGRSGGSGGGGGGRIEALPAGELLECARATLLERAGQAHMALRFSADDSAAGVAARADRVAVEQILFNLVDNACKYGRSLGGAVATGSDSAHGTNTGPPNAEAATPSTGWIAITLSADARWVRLRVQDGGSGIAPSDASRLFQPFQRSAEIAANSATRLPGVGLGLALSRRLARAMRGDLRWVRSSGAAGSAGSAGSAGPATGACFELRLPRG
ncbi:MAG: ATP-binding protein [Planctomycetota bacterium]